MTVFDIFHCNSCNHSNSNPLFIAIEDTCTASIYDASTKSNALDAILNSIIRLNGRTAANTIMCKPFDGTMISNISINVQQMLIFFNRLPLLHKTRNRYSISETHSYQTFFFCFYGSDVLNMRLLVPVNSVTDSIEILHRDIMEASVGKK